MISISPLNAFTNYKNTLRKGDYSCASSHQLKADTFERVAINPISFTGIGNKIKISPSILASDFANLESEIRKFEQAGADWLHVDVADGHLVPNLIIGPPVIKCIRKVTSLPLDVHLMVSNPEKYIEEYRKAGADTITFHYEAAQGNADKILDIIKQIKDSGAKVGLAIDSQTNPEAILQFLPHLDQVLVMTIKAGFAGQKFMEECAQKIPVIKREAQRIGKEDLIIQVDGGINDETGALCREAGANSLVAAAYIMNSKNMAEAIKALRG